MDSPGRGRAERGGGVETTLSGGKAKGGKRSAGERIGRIGEERKGNGGVGRLSGAKREYRVYPISCAFLNSVHC